MKYRPKELIIYSYGFGEYTANIVCYPQSRWEVTNSDIEKVTLKKKGVSIQISMEDFKKQWKAVEES